MSQHWLKPDWEPGLILPQIPIQHFIERNVQALVLDVDGTLITGREVVIHKHVSDWVKNAKKDLNKINQQVLKYYQHLGMVTLIY